MSASPPSTATSVAGLLAAAHEAVRHAHVERATELARQALAAAEGDPAGGRAAVEAHCLMARALSRTAALADAHRHADRALELAEALDDAAARADALVARARVDYKLGDHDAALDALTTALPLARAAGDPLLSFHVENLFGSVLGGVDGSEQSLGWYQRAGAIAREHGLEWEWRLALSNESAEYLGVAEQARARGDHDQAARLLERAAAGLMEALPAIRAYGDPYSEAIALGNIVSARVQQGRHQEALAGLAELHAVVAAGGDPLSLAYAAVDVGRMHLERGDLDGAARTVDEAIAIGDTHGDRAVLALLYEFSAEVRELQGDLGTALAHYRRFHALRTAVSLQGAESRAQVLAVRLDTERALHEATLARVRAQELDEANRELSSRAETLARHSREDGLTGLANRRGLDEGLPARLAAAEEERVPLVVALVDVDHFKRVNDTYSHGTGDEVLRHVGRMLREHCRAGDLAARYGGEEFALVFEGADAEAAWRACERMREAIETFAWDDVHPGLRVTASFGVAAREEGSGAAELLERADRALYRAKREGRNRVRVDAGRA